MLRKVERGAGVAAVVLAFVGLLLLLFAPLITACATHVATVCPASDVRYVSLVQAGASGGAWAFVLGLFVVVLAGGVGAYFDVQAASRIASIALWAGSVVAFAACALGAAGVGLVYLPGVLALCLAAYAALLRRFRAGRAERPSDDETASPPISPI